MSDSLIGKVFGEGATILSVRLRASEENVTLRAYLRRGIALAGLDPAEVYAELCSLFGISLEPPTNSVGLFLEMVRESTAVGVSLPDAVFGVWLTHRRICDDVLETIGSWPSSEPELLELQRRDARGR